MAPPKVKKAKKHSPPRDIATISRKCRKCGLYSMVGPKDACRWCGEPYGRLELGLDLPPAAQPDPSTGPVAK